MRLRESEFVPFAPDEIGGETHIHHCKQGKNNDRLYIRRNEDGSIVAYCHHCGCSGFSRGSATASLDSLLARRDDKRESDGVEVLKNEPILPVDTDFNRDHWPPEAAAWPAKYGLNIEEIEDVICMGWSKHHGRLILPLFDETGSIVGWQGRKIQGLTEEAPYEVWRRDNFPEGTGRCPKYTTRVKQGTKKSDCLFIIKSRRDSHTTSGSDERPNVLCITEDELSAVKCSRFVDAVALNGSGLNKKSLTKLTGYDKIILYLDNDNNQVKMSQTRLKRSLELICNQVVIVKKDRDPKELSDEELKEILLCT